jgi:hypothetical protein
MAVLVE